MKRFMQLLGIVFFAGGLLVIIPAQAEHENQKECSATAFSESGDGQCNQRSIAEWTIVTYIQADNNLAPFAIYNINDMQLATYAGGVNMLVEWDQPNNNKTWRYKIVSGGKIEDASVSTEMGIDPVQELVDMMKWAKTDYDAKRWAVVLWNHGSGVMDPRFRFLNKEFDSKLVVPGSQTRFPWLEIPGLRISTQKDRGILFDDSQGTYATNQDLSTAFSRIKSEVLGRNIDIVGMDACYMQMLEIGYQIKDFADILVGSEETEPGEGWSYSGFLKPLCQNPTSFDSAGLASLIVQAYGQFYKNRTGTFTQSAMNLAMVEPIKQNIDLLIASIGECKKINPEKTRRSVIAARAAAVSFSSPEYIDLYSFYVALAQKIRKKRSSGNSLFGQAKRNVGQILADGIEKITSAVIANTVGSKFKSAKGISIYYPRSGSVHSSYQDTAFAQSTNWIDFIKEYR